METIREEIYKNYTIKIVVDDRPLDPIEEFDSFGKMVCFHKWYSLGHKHNLRSGDFDSLEDVKNYLIKEEKAYIILPLYLYDHSGITISTTPFNCVFDSGQMGFIYATKEQILKEYGVKRITPKIRKKVEKLLIAEVDTYDKYLTGEVYGFQILKDGDIEDSCYGYYDTPKNIMSECKLRIDEYEEQFI